MISGEVVSVAPEGRPTVGAPHVTAVSPAAAATTIPAESLVSAAFVVHPVPVRARRRVAERHLVRVGAVVRAAGLSVVTF
jgi:hypothetical protein